MAGVFISYRREDAPGHAGRVFDRVRARFGADVVFMDVTAIDAGADFVDAIDKAVGTCDVLLAVIGPQWVGAADSAERKRLDIPTDFVRLEIAGALKRDVRVVPVLVDGARLPAAADLPEELQPLLRRNAVELRDARWDADIEQLVASLERIVKPNAEPWRLERGPSLFGRENARRAGSPGRERRCRRSLWSAWLCASARGCRHGHRAARGARRERCSPRAEPE